MEQGGLEVEYRRVAGAVVVSVTGEIDVTTAGVLADALAVAAMAGPRVLVADFAGVAFMDSSGINALLRARLDLLARGARLAVAGVQPPVRRVLDISGVDQIIPLYPTAAQALHGA